MAAFDPFAAPSTDTTPNEPTNEPSISFSTQDWTEQYDATTGQHYYSNQSTGEVSWTKPISLEQASPTTLSPDPFSPKAPTPVSATISSKNTGPPNHTSAAQAAIFGDEADDASENDGLLRRPSFDKEVSKPPPSANMAKKPSVTETTPTNLAQCLNGKLHGECEARVNAVTFLTKSWKPVFWVFDNPRTMLVFRDKENYLDYRANPYLTGAEKEFLVKRRIDFRKPLKCHPISQKSYGISSSSSLYQFKLEEFTDLGPSAMKFGSTNHDILEELRHTVVTTINAAREEIRKRHSIAGGVGAAGTDKSRRNSY